jgi:glutathione S-transferase
MDLYFAPLACSMATRIAFYEAGVEARYLYVDLKTKRLADGSDYRAVNPMGYVPALRADDGELLTENPVVLGYVADRFPAAGLAPEGGGGRHRLQQQLGFIASELHKLVYTPLLDPAANDGARAYAREKAGPRLDRLAAQLEGRETLLERFSVADAYLVTVLNWSRSSGLDLARWPALQAYAARLHERPSVKRALTEELALYKEEQARRSA